MSKDKVKLNIDEGILRIATKADRHGLLIDPPCLLSNAEILAAVMAAGAVAEEKLRIKKKTDKIKNNLDNFD